GLQAGLDIFGVQGAAFVLLGGGTVAIVSARKRKGQRTVEIGGQGIVQRGEKTAAGELYSGVLDRFDEVNAVSNLGGRAIRVGARNNERTAKDGGAVGRRGREHFHDRVRLAASGVLRVEWKIGPDLRQRVGIGREYGHG